MEGGQCVDRGGRRWGEGWWRIGVLLEHIIWPRGTLLVKRPEVKQQSGETTTLKCPRHEGPTVCLTPLYHTGTFWVKNGMRLLWFNKHLLCPHKCVPVAGQWRRPRWVGLLLPTWCPRQTEGEAQDRGTAEPANGPPCPHDNAEWRQQRYACPCLTGTRSQLSLVT